MRQPKYNKKWGNPTKIIRAHEQGRSDAYACKPMDPAMKKHHNKSMAQAYKNGYANGQRQRTPR